MHRLLVSSETLAAAAPILPADAARHLKVLRPKAGEAIELFDGRGRSRVFAWNALRGGLAATDASVVESAPERKIPLTLFACVTKGSRWDWTLEKATELGVGRIVPVLSERTIVRLKNEERAAKRERWARITEDAARQSDAKWLPEVLAPVDFAATLPLVRATTCFVGALAEPPPPPLAAAVAARLEAGGIESAALYVGPEGDFTGAELAALTAAAVPTSFGPSILRAETAAIFGLSVLAALLP